MHQAIRTMTEAIADILKPNQPSIYLIGSVFWDDYRPGWSDIDILCFAEHPLVPTQSDTLLHLRQHLLSQTPDNPYFRRFEGVIAPWEVCAGRMAGTVVYWGTSGERLMDALTLDPFALLQLHNHSRLLYGEDHRERLPRPDFAQLRKAIAEHLDTIRLYGATTGESLYSADWLLDIARCLYTLETGDIAAKTRAGYWALEQNLAPEPDILRKALHIRENPAYALDDANVRAWLTALEPHIMLFADVLEDKLSRRNT